MARAADRIGDQLLLLEHPAVLTLGRGADEAHVLAPPALLEARGIELLRVERGGEVTYHGPGQLVAYPIVKLADRGLLLRPFVRALEAALVDTCAAFGVAADRRDGHPGCWVDPEGPLPRKIGALGHPHRARDELPRHRAQRGRGPRGLRPDRPVRDAGPGLDVDRPRGRPPRRAPVHGAAWPPRPPRSPGRSPPGSTRRSRARLPPDADPPPSGAAPIASAAAWPLTAPRGRAMDAAVAGGIRAMSQGLFELRKDAITGWWVATIVDRTFDRERFAMPAAPGRRPRRLLQLPHPGRRRDPHCGSSRTSRSPSPGPSEEARAREGAVAQVTIADARAAGSWRTVVAPPGEHRPLHAVGNEIIEGLLRALPRRDPGQPRRGPDPAPPGRPELGRPGRGPHQPPLLRPLRPAADPAPDRRGAGRRRPVPDPRGRVPVLPARPRGGPPAGPPALRGRQRGRVRAVRRPLAVRGLGGAASARRGLRPRHGRATSPPRRRRCATSSASSRPASTGRRTTWSSTPRRSRNRSTRPTTGTGRSTPGCARLQAWSWAPGCRSTRCRRRTPWTSSAAVRSRRPTGASTAMNEVRGRRPSHRGGSRRQKGLERAAPDRGEQPILQHRSTRGRRSLELEQRRACPAGFAVSAGWDRDEAYRFVEDLFARHQNEIYAYLVRMLRDPELAADLTQDAFVKAYRAYDSLAEARERAGVAVPDRAPRRPRQPPPQAHRPLRPARRRDPQHQPVGRAPRDGPAPLGRAPAGAREDPGAPARGPAPRRAPRPHRPRARRGPRRVPRRRPRAPHPRPREPAPGARRRAGGHRRQRGRSRRRPPGRPGREPALPPRRRRPRSRPRARRRCAWTSRSSPPTPRGWTPTSPPATHAPPSPRTTTPTASCSRPCARVPGAAAGPVGPDRRRDRRRARPAPSRRPSRTPRPGHAGRVRLPRSPGSPSSRSSWGPRSSTARRSSRPPAGDGPRPRPSP